jgi:uncharacterized protein (DUF983 family)
MDQGMAQNTVKIMVDREVVPDLPPAGWPRLRTLLRRAVLRRCPYCGAGHIFSKWFILRETCPRCGTTFVREDGYFLGGYALNLILAEFVGLAVVLYILFQVDLSLWTREAIAVGAAIALPMIFFPYSRTFWMALDLMLNPRTDEQYLRHGEMVARQRDARH